MSNREITVSHYNEKWPLDFQYLASMYRNSFGNLIIDIHHVGSTSVVGLAAKPRIDIDIEIRPEHFQDVVAEMAKIQYEFKGDLGIKDRYAFKYIGNEILPAHNVYVCPSDSAELRRHLVFRDYLREHPDEVSKYSAIKWDAIEKGSNHINEYMDHKGRVVTEILVKALEWAGIVGVKKEECSSCRTNTQGMFKVEYTGGGMKLEFYEFNCPNCKHVWKNII